MSNVIDKFKNLFIKPADQYTRKVDMIAEYIKQSAEFLHLSAGISVADAEEFVRSTLKTGGKFEFKDPKVEFLMRNEVGDREHRVSTLKKYLDVSLKHGEIIAPTFTTYMSTKRMESILAKLVKTNLHLRKLAKHAQFAARAAKNMFMFAFKKVEQTGRKLSNNALSGAHVSASTPLVNKTAHSSLTSTCRTTSGYGNANNEKFLSGNRHYFDRDVVINNITSIITHVDFEAIDAVIKRHKLHIPTAGEVMDCILYSTQLYWWDRRWRQQIEEYVAKLNDLQRAAFVYVGDAYHLLHHNPDFMRGFLDKLGTKVEGACDDPLGIIEKTPDPYLFLAHQVCRHESLDIKPRDYDKIKGTPALNTIALTCDNVATVVHEHRDLIEAFWQTDNLPASVAHFPDSIRRTALMSDTDSTIFTVQDWLLWYSEGEHFFNDKNHAGYAAIVFLTGATIEHILATMSANIGVDPQYTFSIAMKSEFLFPVFVPTDMGKHYYANKSCQEGQMFSELEMEIKGVQLKNANSPPEVIEAAEKMMEDILVEAMSGRKISIEHWLDYVADQEIKIMNSIRNGERKYFRRGSIKDAESYSGPQEESPFAHHYLWQEVFAPKYGFVVEPPYGTLKINVTTSNPSMTKQWLEQMKDKEMAERIKAHLVSKGKNSISTFYLPTEILTSTGLPEEIRDIVDYEKIVVDICGVYYTLLKTLGYYSLGQKRVRRLVSSEGWGSHRHQKAA